MANVQKKAQQRNQQREAEKRKAERNRKLLIGSSIGLVVTVFIAMVVWAIVLAAGGDETPIVTDPDQFGTESPTPTDTASGEPTEPAPAVALPDRATLEPCDTTVPEGAGADPQQWDAPPAMQIDTAKTYTATIVTTCGDIEVELFAADAPLAVNNLVFLAEQDFYDAVPFHRTIWGFMIQGGDPTGTGSGGPGYAFEDELDTVAKYGYPRGNLAMANSGPNTNGSQFFIIQGDASHLTTHTVFGRVTSGMDIVDRIANMPDQGGLAENPVYITDVIIAEA